LSAPASSVRLFVSRSNAGRRSAERPRSRRRDDDDGRRPRDRAPGGGLRAPRRIAELPRIASEAARIVRRHGGRIHPVIRPTEPAPSDDWPEETHLVSFASAAGLEAHRADPELVALIPLRASAIARTKVTVGVDDYPYPDSPA